VISSKATSQMHGNPARCPDQRERLSAIDGPCSAGETSEVVKKVPLSVKGWNTVIKKMKAPGDGEKITAAWDYFSALSVRPATRWNCFFLFAHRITEGAYNAA
jgi:hypothetical protein